MRRRLILVAFIYIMAFGLSAGTSYAAEQPETIVGTDTEAPSERQTEKQTEPTDEDAEKEPVAQIHTEPETDTVEAADNGGDETEAFEEGAPDFLYQAGGFRVLDEETDAASGICLFSTGDMDGLADKMYKALKGRETSICLLYTSPSPRDS